MRSTVNPRRSLNSGSASSVGWVEANHARADEILYHIGESYRQLKNGARAGETFGTLVIPKA